MRAVCLCLGVLISASCSPARMGMNRMAEALSATAAAYSRDDDPEFVRAGAPATLKMVEMMLDAQPLHRGLLQTACSGFAQYAYAFLHLDSEILLKTDPASAGELRRRATGMYLRARGYCIRALATRHARLGEALRQDFPAALRLLDETASDDVPELYWAGAVWAGELSLAENQIARIAELAVARALLERALAMDEGWGEGAIHEVMIALEGLPAFLGGSPQRARGHFERAVRASGGHSAFPYVTLAAAVAVPAGDRPEFERLLKEALSVDLSARPGLRLANLIAQRRARFLLGAADALFRSAPQSSGPRRSG